jgi:hypothetical protein
MLLSLHSCPRYKHIISTLILCCSTLLASSQIANESDNTEEKEGSHVLLEMNYVNNSVYLGRKDTVKIPYTTPSISYYDASGLFVRGLAAFTNHPSNHLDVVTLEAGYEHSFGNLNTGISADKYFYNKKSTSVKSNITGNINAFAQYTNDYIEPQISLDANFSKGNTDYVLGLLLDHVFYLYHDALTLSPTIAINAGTQHYYDLYISGRNGSNKLKKDKAVSDANKFQLMDIEYSLPINYMYKKWEFTVNPIYIVAKNPAELTLFKPNGTATLFKEKISDSFLMDVTVAFHIPAHATSKKKHA